MLVKQVKMFPMGKHNNYTDKINGFLKKHDKEKILDIKYNTISGEYGDTEHYCIVVYEVEEYEAEV
jgi:hypothetical protein